MEAVTVSTLPEEIQLRIYKHFSVHDWEAMRATCQTANRVCNDRDITQHVFRRGNPLSILKWKILQHYSDTLVYIPGEETWYNYTEGEWYALTNEVIVRKRLTSFFDEFVRIGEFWEEEGDKQESKRFLNFSKKLKMCAFKTRMVKEWKKMAEEI